MVFALVTVVLMAVAAGCSGSVPPPTADVDATVEARVGAAREADLATAEARAEAIRAAAPTDTPVPVPTSTPVPVPTDTPVSTLVPTPEPYVVAPGSVERGVDVLYACLQTHEEFRALFVSGIESSGLDRDSAEGLADLFLEDKDLFVQGLLEWAGEDPEGASLLSLYSMMEEEMEEFCGDLGLGPAGARGLEPDRVQDLGMSDAEARAVLEAFHDCVNSNEEVRSYFLSPVGSDDLGEELYSKFLSMDRNFVVDFLLASAKENPYSAEMLSELDVLVGVECR